MTRRGEAESDSTGLPPRVLPVLKQLLEGRSEKEAARELRLSPHTVHQYVKLLYRHLGVRSRGELMAKWVRRPVRRKD